MDKHANDTSTGLDGMLGVTQLDGRSNFKPQPRPHKPDRPLQPQVTPRAAVQKIDSKKHPEPPLKKAPPPVLPSRPATWLDPKFLPKSPSFSRPSTAPSSAAPPTPEVLRSPSSSRKASRAPSQEGLARNSFHPSITGELKALARSDGEEHAHQRTNFTLSPDDTHIGGKAESYSSMLDYHPDSSPLISRSDSMRIALRHGVHTRPTTADLTGGRVMRLSADSAGSVEMLAAVRNAGEALNEGRDAFRKGMTYEGMIMQGRPVKSAVSRSSLSRSESRRAYAEALETMQRLSAGGHGFTATPVTTTMEE